MLSNVPVGTNIPLVMQLGRWRRQITISTVNACVNNALPASSTRLPRTKAEGDIPLMAFSTGSVDALECVWRKIGVADSEFTGPNGNGRIHIYQGNISPGYGGATISGVQSEGVLMGTATQVNKYDMVLFPCQGTPGSCRTATELANLLQYVNAGGRVFSTHYSYVWLYTNGSLATAATWTPDQWNIWDDPNIGYINQTFPKGQAFAPGRPAAAAACPASAARRRAPPPPALRRGGTAARRPTAARGCSNAGPAPRLRPAAAAARPTSAAAAEYRS